MWTAWTKDRKRRCVSSPLSTKLIVNRVNLFSHTQVFSLVHVEHHVLYNNHMAKYIHSAHMCVRVQTSSVLNHRSKFNILNKGKSESFIQ